MRIIAVIAAYNEEKRVAASVADALKYVDAAVVVDDCSRDNTAAVALAAGAHVLRHIINRGQGAALQTGTDYALQVLSADILVHFDADGQMRAEDIPALVAPLISGEAEVAIGSRFLGASEGMPLVRRLGYIPARIFSTILTGLFITDVHCGFRALTAKAAKRLRITLDRMAHASEVLDLLAASRLPYKEVPVTIRYTGETLGKSSYLGSFFGRALRVVVDLLKKRIL